MIKKLSTSEGNILEYEATEKITEAEDEMMLREVKQAIDEFGKVNLLVRLVNFPKVELSALTNRFSFAKEHHDDLGRYAIVTDSSGVSAIQSVVNVFTGVEIKTFSLEEEEQARAWLR